MEDGKEILAFFPHADRRRWIAWTPEDYYMSSPHGDELIGWHLNNGKDQEADFYNAVQFERILYRPDYVLAYYRTRRWAAPFAALCFVLACYTKQPAVMFLPFAVLYLLSIDKRACLLFSGLVSLGMLALFFWLHSTTDGWFTTFTIVTPFGYNENLAGTMPNVYSELVEQIRIRLAGQMRYELFYELPIFLTLLTALVLVRIVRLKRPFGFSIWEYTLIPAVTTYFLVRPNVGTEKNDFMYFTLWGCIALGCGFTRLCAGRAVRDKRTVLTVLYWLLGVQLALQLYNPFNCIPAPGSARKGHEFISMVRAMPGEVYIPYHAMYGVLAGKEMIFNAGIFWGYQMLSTEGYTPTDLIEKINRKHFAAIIIDEKSHLIMLGQKLEFDNVGLLLSAQEPLSQAIARNYRIGYRIPYESSRQFLTVTGFFTRPELVLLPHPS